MKRLTRSGFTIVELLIVIVVISILAAITIVAYNGIQQRATDSSLLSSLSQVSKKLNAYNIENGLYPANLAAAGVQDTSDMSYQYSQTSSTFCVTATKGTQSKYVSDTQNTALNGACAGHGANGSGPFTATYLQSASSTNDQGSYTYTAQNLGAESPGRTIVIAISARSGTSYAINSVSIGGVTAQIDVQTTRSGSISAIASAVIPSGTQEDVEVVYSGTMLRSAIGLYRLTGPPVTVSSTAVANSTMTITGAANGIVIASGFRAGVTSMSWTNATMNENIPTEGNVASFASTLSSGSLTITASGSGGNNPSLAGVAYVVQ